MATENDRRWRVTPSLAAYTLFWAYNVLWVVCDAWFASMLTWDAPNLGLPTKVLLLSAAICLLPLPTMVFGALLPRSERAHRLLRLLYGVEVPIQGLLFLAVLFLRQATGAVWLLAAGAATAAFGLAVLARAEGMRRLLSDWLLLFSQTLGLLLVTYVLLLWLFFLPLVLVMADPPDAASFAHLMNSPLAVIPFALLNGLISPFAATAVYLGSFRRQFAAVAGRAGFRQTAVAVAAFGALFVAIAIALAWQPSSARLHAAVESFRQARSFEDRQAASRVLAPQLPALRRSLAGAYLAPYRYVIDRDTLPLLKSRGSAWDTWGARVEVAIERLVAPFVYRGRFREDALWAADAYRDVFGEGIQNGEHETIETTLRDTFTRDERAAGLLDRYRKTVRVVSQQVRVAWDGRSAVVTIEEAYENTADEVQEVLYEFSLPESAVITGLWLGPSLEFEGVLAARGAARNVYEAQLVRSKDPALLEQTGPRQYRLRVFPVPVQAAQTPGRQARPLRAAFRYVLLPEREQGFPIVALPRLYESRNVFWDASLESRVTGSVAPPPARSAEHWSAGRAFRVTAPMTASPRTKFQIGDAAVTLRPETQGTAAAPLTARHIAVLLDASHGSAGQDWRSLEGDPDFALLVRWHRVDAYFFNDALGPAIPLAEPGWSERLTGVVPLGRPRLQQALQPLCDAGYDSILVLTAGGRVGDSDVADRPCEGPPVAIVHLDGRIPAYTDALSRRALQGCGVHDSLAGAIRCLSAPTPDAGTRRAFLTSAEVLEHSCADASARLPPCPPNEPRCQVLAHRVALMKLADSEPDSAGLPLAATMAEVHSLATRFGVLTPSSSLIVLVDDWQRKELAEASQGKDAFAPAGTGTEEEIEAPSGQGLLNVQGVPEPETWILLSCAAVVLALFLWRQWMA